MFLCLTCYIHFIVMLNLDVVHVLFQDPPAVIPMTESTRGSSSRTPPDHPSSRSVPRDPLSLPWRPSNATCPRICRTVCPCLSGEARPCLPALELATARRKTAGTICNTQRKYIPFYSGGNKITMIIQKCI